MRPQLRAAAARRCRVPSSSTLPGRRLDQPQDGWPTVDLPQPDSPTRPSVSPRPIAKLTPSTACTCPPARRTGPRRDREMLAQVADLEQRLASRSCARLRAAAARASRSAPPSGPWPALARAAAPRRGSASVARAAARREARSPRIGRSSARHHARDLGQRGRRRRVPRRRRAAASSRSRPARVGMRGAREQRRRPAASSTMRPAYITTTRSRGLGDHAEVVGDQDDRRAELALQLAHQVEDLRLDRDVERGGRLVGDQQLAGCRPAPWRSSRAGACRPRAGAGTRRARRCGSGMPHQVAASRPRARAPRAGRAAGAAQRLGDLLADGEHRVERGHRLLEDHRDLVAADGAHLALVDSVSRSRPSKRIEPPAIRPAASGSRRRIDSAVTLLPQPRLADDAQRLARAARRRTRRRPRARRRRGVNETAGRRSEIGSREPLRCPGRGGGRCVIVPQSRLRHARVERVAQAVAQQVDRQHGDRQEDAGEEDDPGRDLDRRRGPRP